MTYFLILAVHIIGVICCLLNVEYVLSIIIIITFIIVIITTIIIVVIIDPL